MVRASSLGLCLPPSVIRGCQQCLSPHRVKCRFQFLRQPTQLLGIRPMTRSATQLGESDGKLFTRETGKLRSPTKDTMARIQLAGSLENQVTNEENNYLDGDTTVNTLKTPSITFATDRPAFTLPPPSQMKPRVYLGTPNRRTARALGKEFPQGFEQLTHRTPPKPLSKTAKRERKYYGKGIHILKARAKFSRERGNSQVSHLKSGTGSANLHAHQQSKPFSPDTPPLQDLNFITAEVPYEVGRPWRPLPVKPMTFLPRPHPTNDLERARHTWLYTLHTTYSAVIGWDAYNSLLEHAPPVPLSLLHRLARLLARDEPNPKTHAVYLRLLSVLSALRAAGGTVYPHEWNALINAAGGGLRRTTASQYEAALSYFRDMTTGRVPGTTLELGNREAQFQDAQSQSVAIVEPDIYTYTTLINIAARTGDLKCVQHAKGLLDHSGIPANRYTHLALLKYFVMTRQPAAVRSTLLRLQQQSMELGLDGINACLTAYSYNNRLDVVMFIYRMLKYNADPDLDDAKEIEQIKHRLEKEEFIVVPSYLLPNEITYTSMVQILSYHGHLHDALAIFTDMITALNIERGAPLVRDANGELKPTNYDATIHVFRALFLGFSRHGIVIPKDGRVPSHLRGANPPGLPGWTLENLEKLFHSFVQMPLDMQVGPQLFAWIIWAFRRTSNSDTETLRRVWKKLEERFAGPWGSVGGRLLRFRAKLFPKETWGRGGPSHPRPGQQ